MRRRRLTTTKILIAAFLLLALIFPIIRIFIYIGEVDVLPFLSSPLLWAAAKNSLVVASTGALIAIVIALCLSYCVTRTAMPFKEGFSVLLTLPMLIPSIAHGMGLVILLGTNGLLTKLFNLHWTVYGFWGIVMGSVLYAFPLAFLMLRDVLQYEDQSAYDAATILGIPKWSQFISITLPYLRKPLIAVAFATFAIIVTDYGVPLMVGGLYKTLPVMMYQEVIGLLDFGKGSVIGVILLLPALVSFVIDTLNKESESTSFSAPEERVQKSRILKWVAIGFCLAAVLCVILPVIAFGVLTFVEDYPYRMAFTMEHVVSTFETNVRGYFVNSLVVSGAVAVIGAVISYATAYVTSRTGGKSARVLHLLSISSLAIPGLVLGLSYVLFFRGTPLYGTLAILVMANTMHFFASPYLMAYNSLYKINSNLEAVGTTLGLKRRNIIKDVLIPQTWPTILEMASYFFVNSMITISAISFLSNVSTKPLALMITSFEAQARMESAALVALLILVANLLAKTLFWLVKTALKRRAEA
jgi:iron(III) transport system permease protein